MTDSETQLERLVRQYTSGPDARALYVYNGPIYEPQVEALFSVIEPNSEVDASLFLCTTGGDPHSAYRLTRRLRDSHKSLRLLLADPARARERWSQSARTASRSRLWASWDRSTFR